MSLTEKERGWYLMKIQELLKADYDLELGIGAISDVLQAAADIEKNEDLRLDD